MNKLSVIVPTYNRPWILKKTIELLKKNLIYSGDIVFYIGMDGDLSIGKMFAGHSDIICIPGPNNGLGANINRLIGACDSDYIFQMDDDHHLQQELDVTRHIQELEWNERVGWVRLMGCAYHNYRAKLKGDYWHIDWDSPEVYITSNRPHVKHRRFHEHFGMYPEGVKLGQTEEIFCQQCKDKYDKRYNVVMPVRDIEWGHVGDSWQLKGK